MNLIAEYFNHFIEYMQSGGFVMWPLFILAALLWFALGYRFHALTRGSKKSVRNLIRKYRLGDRTKVKGLIDEAIVEALAVQEGYKECLRCRELINDAFYKYRVRLRKYRKIIITIVAVAPLIGLLGTVVGMIETFDSLASAALFSQSGGIAGGISQALFTTQLGLVVAVPGLVFGKILERHANNMELDLEQIQDLLCSEGV